MRSADDGAAAAALPARPFRRTLLAVCAGVLALVCGLILAAGAHAAEPVTEHEAVTEQSPATGSQGTASESVGSGSGAPGPSEQETTSTQSGEGTTEGSTAGSGTGTGVTTGEKTETTPAEQVVTPAKEPEPAPTEQVVQPPAKQPETLPTEQAGTQAPVEVHAETTTTHETPAGEHGTEASTTPTEQSGGASQSGVEQSAKGSQSSTPLGVPLSGGPTGGSPSTGTQAAAIAPFATLTSAQGEGTNEPPFVLGRGGAGSSAAGAAAKSAAFGSGPLGCELLSTDMSGVCPEALSTRRLLAAGPLDAVASAASLAAAASGVRGAEAHGRTAVMTPPASPTPSPQPSGASGAGSAGGGGGLALSGFLSLAGLLLLAAPRAMRRLRLLCRPWRAACFALIPERPG